VPRVRAVAEARDEPRRDLATRAQVHDLVVAFYREIVFDDVLGPVFEEVAEVDWAVHIPKLIDFWCQLLLGEPGYDGSVWFAHREIDASERFRPEFFDRWYGLWCDTVDDGWCGPVADAAKAHATRIATMLARRLDVDWSAERVLAARAARPARSGR
jgi:hemoglobin